MKHCPSGTFLNGSKLFFCTLCWFAFSLSFAQTQPLRSSADRLLIDSLPPQGVLLNKGWRWHAGDNPNWSNPTFDDRSWQAIDPTKDIMELPNVQHAGVSWFRLHLVIKPSVLTESLAFLITQTGASEVYLNGRLVNQFGRIDRSGQAIQTYNPRSEPVSLSVSGDSLQTVAVRFACGEDVLYTTEFIGKNALFQARINNVTNAVRYYRIYGLSILPLDYAKAGIFFILAILHLAFYLYYPVQRANLYFSLFSLCCMVTYYLQTQLDAQSVESLQGKLIGIAILTNLFHLLQLNALYSLFKRPLGVSYWLLFSWFLVNVPLTVWPYAWGLRIGHELYYLVCLGESIRVTVLAVRQKQRGASIIIRGVIIALVFTSMYTFSLPFSFRSTYYQQLFLTGNWVYYAYLHLPYNVGYLSIPVAISLYLGLEFAFTSRTLENKLVEIQALSEKTLAQETEKLKLVAEQNEVLEQTVLERTEKIQQQADKLREVDAIKSRFFTNLTHEFRTPLTLMLGPAEQVLAETGEPKTRQQVGLLHRNAQRLLRLINQLLDLSKLEAGKTQLILSSQDMISLVKGTLLSFESLAEQKQISLRVTADRDRLMMDIDRDKLEKILYNLFSNALKFTRSGGEVLVSLTQEAVGEEPWVQLMVRDTGVGIPAAKLPYVFDQFYQVDASNTREQEGFGIGLALTKELVELHDGRIHIDSQEGVWTTITVRLPVRQEHHVEHELVNDKVGSRLPTSYRGVSDQVQDPLLQSPEGADAAELLLIEDNDEVRQFIRSSLGHQYRIIEAMNGEEGVRLAQEHVPDLVITDLMMPKLDGHQVCAVLKRDERTSHIPIVMLTAKADLDSRIQGLQTGADSYLAKPFHQRELLAQIANLIASRQQLRERFSRDNLWHTEDALPSMEQAFLDRVRTAIDAHLDDEGFNVDQLSDDMGVSRTQLHRKLKALVNQSPGDLIRVVRLQRALDLLTRNVATVSEVAYMVGFGNPANFSTSFSRHFGYAPSEVKKKVSSAAS